MIGRIDRESLRARSARLIRDPNLVDELRICLQKFFAWGEAPTVEAYVDLFAPDATLIDAGMPRPLGYAEIRDAITGILTFVVPDFQLRPIGIAHRRPHLFVEALNQATVAGTCVRWPAVYCLTVDRQGRITRGRRYYDQAVLLGALQGHRHHPLVGGMSASRGMDAKGARAFANSIDLNSRAQAWHDGDVAMLCGSHRWSQLAAPGLGAPVRDVGAAIDYVGKFVELAAPDVRPVTAIRAGASLFVEWVGTSLHDKAKRVAFVEILGSRADRASTWRLYFDSVSLVTDLDKEAREIRRQIYEPGPDGVAADGSSSSPDRRSLPGQRVERRAVGPRQWQPPEHTR